MLPVKSTTAVSWGIQKEDTLFRNALFLCNLFLIFSLFMNTMSTLQTKVCLSTSASLDSGQLQA